MSNIKNRLRYKNPQCYAHPLGGCSGRLTKEHYISKGVLSRIGKSGEVYVKGFPWQDQPSKPEPFSIKRLSARMLCDGHHKALNKLKLDNAACRLLDDMKLIFHSLSGCLTSPLNEVYRHNGQCIERWLLKVLCGVFASGTAPRSAPNITIPAQKVPLHLLRALFGLSKFPQGCGLYLQNPEQQQINMREGLRFAWMATESDSHMDLHACSINLFGPEFMLLIDQTVLEDPKRGLQKWVYRPTSALSI